MIDEAATFQHPGFAAWRDVPLFAVGMPPSFPDTLSRFGNWRRDRLVLRVSASRLLRFAAHPPQPHMPSFSRNSKIFANKQSRAGKESSIDIVQCASDLYGGNMPCNFEVYGCSGSSGQQERNKYLVERLENDINYLGI